MNSVSEIKGPRPRLRVNPKPVDKSNETEEKGTKSIQRIFIYVSLGAALHARRLVITYI
jgi:hypothetical protein